jgi:hypothetical protein
MIVRFTRPRPPPSSARTPQNGSSQEKQFRSGQWTTALVLVTAIHLLSQASQYSLVTPSCRAGDNFRHPGADSRVPSGQMVNRSPTFDDVLRAGTGCKTCSETPWPRAADPEFL